MDVNPYESPHVFSPNAERRLSLLTEAEYSVDCDCGATVPVKASDAGGFVTCRCSRIVRVPKLSQLRLAQGRGAHETNIRDVISRMIRENALPWGQCCAVTEMPTEDVVWFDVQCESSYTKGSRRWGTTLIAVSFVLPLGFLFRLLGFGMLDEANERLGRDIAIAVPLRVAKEAQISLRRWTTTQRRLKMLLCRVPVYQELFREHPRARISLR